ncbi:MAG: alkane 1-monooxygenase [Saprospiraceae bacterium]
MRDLKYLFSYTAPLAAFISFYFGGVWSFSLLYLAFIIIPVVELFYQGTSENLTMEEEDSQLKKVLFDLMLYMNVPMIFGLQIFYFYTVAQGGLFWWELLGMTLSAGILIGADGINVAHELGHRNTWYERLMSKILLLPSFYLHFIIEHNYGHHKWVSTDKDPATSRLNENIYFFFVRSTVMGYISAWKLSGELTKKKGHTAFGFRNPMYQYTAIQLAYVAVAIALFSWSILPYVIISGIIGFLMLECVNYIEHYGLRRKKLASGRYEPVKPHHSWNSNHELGRIFLYELTRHSDHHYKANRKYQVLRHFEKSPQLPLGYPGSILLALFPPAWFLYMNPKVKAEQERIDKAFTMSGKAVAA